MFPIELLTTSGMAQAEQLSLDSGATGIDLMERAGAGIAELATSLAPQAEIIAILCGPGNNGGDGFIAARLLRERGFSICLGLLGQPAALKGDAAEAARRWAGAIEPAETLDFAKADLRADLIVDALFGSGLARDLDGLARNLVERLNDWRRTTGRPLLAVDVPSGLDANTGEVRGAAVEASDTMTFFRLRPGHLLMPGRALAGTLHVHDIGVPDSILASIQPKTFANLPALWRAHFPTPAADGHKYSRGHALLVSGGPWSTGAARLAGRGALRAGAGLVTLASPRDALVINASHLTAIMLAPCDGPDELAAILADRRFSAVVLGPGLGVGAANRSLVLAALAAKPGERTIVLDADALTSFEAAPQALFDAIAASEMSVVLTPHEGEFTRLFKASRAKVESFSQAPDSISQAPELLSAQYRPADKLTRACAAARLSGAIVLLKGSDTIIAAPDGRAAIAVETSPWLATAGSGDVLAGMIAGLAAQGMPAFEAACAGAWLHAMAGRTLGPGLIAEDLPETLPRVLEELLK